jgi:hypothetical protein
VMSGDRCACKSTARVGQNGSFPIYSRGLSADHFCPELFGAYPAPASALDGQLWAIQRPFGRAARGTKPARVAELADLRWSTRRRFDPSSSPSATINMLAVPQAEKTAKIPRILPEFSSPENLAGRLVSCRLRLENGFFSRAFVPFQLVRSLISLKSEWIPGRPF